MSNSNLDLSQLALNRSPTRPPAADPRRNKWLVRYVLPAIILLGFVVLLLATAGIQLWPRTTVTVMPVIVKRGTVSQAGTPLFQAAGWIEPRPTPVTVPALISGVIEHLLVVEGQQVKQGEPIAHLIAIDAELRVERAQALLAQRQSELSRAQAEQRAAETRLSKPVHLHALLADAQSLLAKAKTEYDKLPFLITAADAQVAFTRRSLDGKRAAGTAVAGLVLEQANQSHAAAIAELEELQARQPNLKHEIETLREKVRAIDEQLSLLVEERRQLAEAQAKVALETARRDEAELSVREAELALARTIVRAPIDGRVLRLVASPGARVAGMEASGNTSAVIEMYDPNRLQVRADVRLEDVPLVIVGAPVKIETASSGKTIAGHVLRATSSANVQKNTLEVKVELVDPPATISPEMLVTATFLAPNVAADPADAQDAERLYAPRSLIRNDDDGSFVWIVDAQSRAIKRNVTLGSDAEDGLVEVTEGLVITDKLIAANVDALEDGAHVTLGGEDTTIGIGG